MANFSVNIFDHSSLDLADYDVQTEITSATNGATNGFQEYHGAGPHNGGNTVGSYLYLSPEFWNPHQRPTESTAGFLTADFQMHGQQESPSRDPFGSFSDYGHSASDSKYTASNDIFCHFSSHTDYPLVSAAPNYDWSTMTGDNCEMLDQPLDELPFQQPSCPQTDLADYAQTPVAAPSDDYQNHLDSYQQALYAPENSSTPAAPTKGKLRRKRSRGKPGVEYTCPFNKCPRNRNQPEQGFARHDNYLAHLRTVHKMVIRKRPAGRPRKDSSSRQDYLNSF
ncbi:hypothetical protein BJ508DRAFT_311645 [Ascobolus immersus RN42]|uniref:Uncharacterized protein n=1 Tax=Ascobolus immersus RN42 TaxID=1160509 RepID=A0A3N4HS74_ASCIM|nr:hypothetical protein BJ508DRAFT_311645 [Ascobolus immersus RN42]